MSLIAMLFDKYLRFFAITSPEERQNTTTDLMRMPFHLNTPETHSPKGCF